MISTVFSRWLISDNTLTKCVNVYNNDATRYNLLEDKNAYLGLKHFNTLQYLSISSIKFRIIFSFTSNVRSICERL